MSAVFEERVGQELDALYHGALFQTAGSDQDAELLLMDTLVGASHEGGSTASARWFEARLARRFLASTVAPTPTDTRFADITPVSTLSANDLVRGAAAVPTWARAALWLILLREWSYRDACAVLGVTIETLRRMLEYRHVLVRATLHSGPAVDDANGSVT